MVTYLVGQCWHHSKLRLINAVDMIN